MNRRQLLGTAAIGLVAAAFSGAATAQARRPPNFVVILCDDLGYGDVEPFGGTIPTPAINRMAREGLVATDYYCPANICSPSRAGLLTGRYPVRTGLGYEVILAGDDRVLPRSEKTIADALKPVYATGLFGKWHLGHMGPTWLPTYYGFDRFFGIPYSHDMKPLAVYDADASGKVTSEPADHASLQQRFYARAERFIEDNRARPFFIELALSAPHLPEHPSGTFKGSSRKGAYGDVVQEIDSIVGRLMEKLRSLKLERDTFVIFTSDNGPWYEGSSGPFRDRKGGAGYDGGYRVPFIAWAPGRIPARAKTDTIICGIDLLPTFCALAGLPPPQGVELDGRDISPVLAGRGGASPHDEILLFNNEDVVGVRTQRWKFVDQTYYRGIKVNLGASGEMDQLYDLSQDPAESYSVAATYPDVARDMKARLRAAREVYGPYRKGAPPFFKKLQQEFLRRQD